MKHTIQIKLLSDATFGIGDGVAGLVDQEVEHDRETGLPFVRGRTVKGLLVEACADILYGLGSNGEVWHSVAADLFGTPGSREDNDAKMQVGDAVFPHDLQQAIIYALHDKKQNKDGWLTSERILDSVTGIRRQTSVNAETDRPEDGSLRSMRVLMKDTTLISTLTFAQNATSKQLQLLAACCAAVQRGGTGRNRGRGRIQLVLNDETQQKTQLATFAQHVKGGKNE